MEDDQPMKCYIHALSPVKKSSSKRKFFNCWLQNEEDVVRAVCFAPSKHNEIDSLKKTKAPINIYQYRRGPNGEVILDDKSKYKPVEDVGFPYREPVATNDVVTIANLANVATEQIVMIKAEVASVSGIKAIQTQHQGTLRKQDVTLRDPTSSIKLVLWGDHINSLEANKTYLLENLKVKSNRYGHYLNTPKDVQFQYHIIEPFEQDLVEVDDAAVGNDTISGRVIAINQITRKISCVSCNKKVVECQDNPSFGECETMQNLHFCDLQWMVRIIVQQSNDPTVKRRLILYNQQLRMFADVIHVPMNLQSISEKEVVNALLLAQEFTFSYESNTQKVTDITIV